MSLARPSGNGKVSKQSLVEYLSRVSSVLPYFRIHSLCKVDERMPSRWLEASAKICIGAAKTHFASTGNGVMYLLTKGMAITRSSVETALYNLALRSPYCHHFCGRGALN